MEELTKQKCVPCEGGVPKMTKEEVDQQLAKLDGWQNPDDMLIKQFQFENYKQVMPFVTGVMELAEEEGHHPDMHVAYDKVGIALLTHAAHGLTMNDFILAAKIDELQKG